MIFVRYVHFPGHVINEADYKQLDSVFSLKFSRERGHNLKDDHSIDTSHIKEGSMMISLLLRLANTRDLCDFRDEPSQIRHCQDVKRQVGII